MMEERYVINKSLLKSIRIHLFIHL